MNQCAQNEFIVESIGENPHQPKDFVYPKRNYGSRDRSFQCLWYKEFSWLHYLEGVDKVLCHMCVTAKSRNLLISIHKTNPASLFDGFCN